jgi:hypothetical protein
MAFLATLYFFFGAAESGSNSDFLCIQLLIQRMTTAKKSPVESPHMRMPVNVSTGARIRHGLGNMRSPEPRLV